MQIDWSIEQLERQSDTGGIIVAHWRVSAQDDGFFASSYGSSGFQPNPEDENFIPFENLVETDVLNWLWSKDSFDKESIEENLIQKIERQKNPPTISGLPWK